MCDSSKKTSNSPSFAVRIVRRARELGALAHAHVHDALVPTFDDAALADVVAEGHLQGGRNKGGGKSGSKTGGGGVARI